MRHGYCWQFLPDWLRSWSHDGEALSRRTNHAVQLTCGSIYVAEWIIGDRITKLERRPPEARLYIVSSCS